MKGKYGNHPATTSASASDEIHALWDRLAEADVADTDASMRTLLQGLCDLVSASTANAITAVRVDASASDASRGWRAHGVTNLHPNADLLRMHQTSARLLKAGEADITTFNNIAGAGTWRANRLVDLAPPEWFASPAREQRYLSLGRHDAIWAGCPVNDDAELYFGVFRGESQPCFTEDECEQVGRALRGLKWFCRLFLLSHGVCVAESPLTPAEREVLQGLLRGGPEKQIAAQLGHSPHTTHGFVKSIYRKFNVKNRASLMALWLGRQS